MHHWRCLQACLAARSWAGAADAETAEFFAELDALLAASWQVKGEYGQVSKVESA